MAGHGRQRAAPARSSRGIATTLAAAGDTNAVLLGNHGLLAFGSSAIAAVKLVMVLEEAAEAELAAVALGGAKDIRTGR